MVKLAAVPKPPLSLHPQPYTVHAVLFIVGSLLFFVNPLKAEFRYLAQYLVHHVP